MEYRESFWTVWRSLFRSAPFLFLPLIQFFFSPSPSLFFTAQGGIGLMLFLYFLLRWAATRWVAAPNHLERRQHFPVSSRLRIPRSRIALAEQSKTIFPGAWQLSLWSERRKKPLRIFLSKNVLPAFLFFPSQGKTLSPSFWVRLRDAFVSSNGFAGWLLLSGFSRVTGRFLGISLEREALRRFPHPISLEAFPEAFSLLANLLLLGWAVSFLTAFFRRNGWRICSTGKDFLLQRSFLLERRSWVPGIHILAAIQRQNLLQRLGGLWQGFLLLPVPTGRKQRMNDFPAQAQKILIHSIRVPKSQRYRYFLPLIPLWSCWLWMLLCLRWIFFFSWNGVTAILFFPAAFLLLKTISLRGLADFTSISPNLRFFTTGRGTRRWAVEIANPKELFLRLRQTPGQRREGICSLYLAPGRSPNRGFRLSHLPANALYDSVIALK